MAQWLPHWPLPALLAALRWHCERNTNAQTDRARRAPERDQHPGPRRSLWPAPLLLLPPQPLLLLLTLRLPSSSKRFLLPPLLTRPVTASSSSPSPANRASFAPACTLRAANPPPVRRLFFSFSPPPSLLLLHGIVARLASSRLRGPSFLEAFALLASPQVKEQERTAAASTEWTADGFPTRASFSESSLPFTPTMRLNLRPCLPGHAARSPRDETVLASSPAVCRRKHNFFQCGSIIQLKCGAPGGQQWRTSGRPVPVARNNGPQQEVCVSVSGCDLACSRARSPHPCPCPRLGITIRDDHHTRDLIGLHFLLPGAPRWPAARTPCPDVCPLGHATSGPRCADARKSRHAAAMARAAPRLRRALHLIAQCRVSRLSGR